MPYAIETFNLTKKYPQIRGYRELIIHPFKGKKITALDNVSIQVNKGELLGLLGPNGAGKTTLIKILCTLVLPTEGKALVNGHDLEHAGREIRKIIGYVVSEERSFYWRLTGSQNLRFFATLNGFSSLEASERIDEVLKLTGLQDDAARMFKDYSTGMRQRLAIARAMLTNPEILFMDEPTRSLDPLTSHKLRKFIKEQVVHEQGKTVFFATHNLPEAEELSDRIVILDGGKVKICGTLTDIRQYLSKKQNYIIHLRVTSDRLLDKIRSLKGINNLQVSEPAIGDGVTLELELDSETGDISAVLEGIIQSGGYITACIPKEASLEEMFTQISGGD